MTACPKCGSDPLSYFSYEVTKTGHKTPDVKKAGRHCSKCGYSDGDWNQIAQDRPDKILLSDFENLPPRSKLRDLAPLIVISGIWAAFTLYLIHQAWTMDPDAVTKGVGIGISIGMALAIAIEVWMDRR